MVVAASSVPTCRPQSYYHFKEGIVFFPFIIFIWPNPFISRVAHTHSLNTPLPLSFTFCNADCYLQIEGFPSSGTIMLTRPLTIPLVQSLTNWATRKQDNTLNLSDNRTPFLFHSRHHSNMNLQNKIFRGRHLRKKRVSLTLYPSLLPMRGSNDGYTQVSWAPATHVRGVAKAQELEAPAQRSSTWQRLLFLPTPEKGG